MSEEEVIRHLGQPDEIATRDAPKSIASFDPTNHPRKTIENKVLMYNRDGYYAYIYLNSQNIVEDIILGGP
ncbi:MAG: hypothetical protein RDV48_30925 [Candidatus Eremiobacteraeota bacterium]|nr:hypothetical protein [Candidatus Eremiobacteraeota bacterium]